MLQRARLGALAGLAGGVPFGMMMGMMGMLTKIAGMMGAQSALVGFAIHMMISAMIGVGFGVALGGLVSSRNRAVGAGAAYGMAWWVLGPLTLMPLMMGMGLGAQWNGGAIAAALPSLMGHMVYGVVAGLVYERLARARAAALVVRTV